MTIIEIFLLIAILILLLILINYKCLTKTTKKIIAANNNKLTKIFTIFKNIYRSFQKTRHFSILYIFKNKFYWLYLVFALVVVIVKISLYYNLIAKASLPIWIIRSTDFLIVTAGWELICIITKFIEDQVTKK